MDQSAQAIPLLLITGPTASGKTTLALKLAQGLQGEIVNADAMAVYQGMDIGTAKPSLAERSLVPHHVLDCFPVDQPCNVQHWLLRAEQAIQDIAKRGRPVIVCGGSPLYIKALLEGLSPGPGRNPELRAALEARLEREGAAALYAELQQVDPVYASERHPNDHRRIIRALEVWQLSGIPYSQHHVTDGRRRPEYRSLLLAPHWPRDELYRRINARCKALFAQGLVEEVRSLAHRLCPEARQAVGYKEVLSYLDGQCSLEDAAEQSRRASRRLAKHQLTWLRRFRDIEWLDGASIDLHNITKRLQRFFSEL